MNAPTNSRRSLLGAALAVPAAAAMPSPALSAADQIQQASDAVSVAMARLHPGKWRAVVSHENGGFVLIAPYMTKGDAQ